jgi:hypothetical protein
VFVMKALGHRSSIIVSLNLGLKHSYWLCPEDLLEIGKVAEDEVTEFNCDGLAVPFGGPRDFVPNWHLTSRHQQAES